MTTAIERTFEQLEQVIERGLQTFIEVGQALLEIRDRKLYLEEYSTFETYCKERWGWGRNYVNKQIAAAEVTLNLGTNVPKPQTEAQVRPLTSLSPDEQRAVWQAAIGPNGSQPTAKQVMAEVVRRVKERLAAENPPPPPPDPERLREEKALRDEMRKNSEYYSSLLGIVHAVEALAAPEVPISEVAEWIEKYDMPDVDYRGKMPKAVETLTELWKELHL